MTVTPQLTACDTQTEKLTTAFALPPGITGHARRVARVPALDPDLPGACPLTAEQTNRIARKAALSLGPTGVDFCLKSFASDSAARASAA